MIKKPNVDWDDVKGNLSAILSGLPVERYGSPVASFDTRLYRWPPAEEDALYVTVTETTARYLGMAASRDTYLTVARRVTDQPKVAALHHIDFDPNKREITGVSDAVVSLEDTAGTSVGFFRRQLDARQAKKLGLLDPTEDDFNLLGNELENGRNHRLREQG